MTKLSEAELQALREGREPTKITNPPKQHFIGRALGGGKVNRKPKEPVKPHPYASDPRVKLHSWSAARYWRRKRKPKMRRIYVEEKHGGHIFARPLRKRHDYVHGR